MDSERATALIAQLGENVSELKEALEPLSKGDLNTVATDLPVLDRASLYVHTAYAIETILFSNLKLLGVDTKEHPIMTEIARLRQYQQKLDIAENGEQKPNMRLDKAAAGRMVKHDLASVSLKGTKRRFDEDGQVASPSPAATIPDAVRDQEVESPAPARTESRPKKKGKKKQK